MRLELEVLGEQLVNRQLVRFGEHAGDARPALRSIASFMRLTELQRFDRQGPGWARLKPATVERKVRAGLDPRILRATEEMRQSLVGRGTGHVEEVTAASLRFGTTVPYAKFHQTGTSRMPQRRVVDFTEAQKREITKRLQRWIVTGEA